MINCVSSICSNMHIPLHHHFTDQCRDVIHNVNKLFVCIADSQRCNEKRGSFNVGEFHQGTCSGVDTAEAKLDKGAFNS